MTIDPAAAPRPPAPPVTVRAFGVVALVRVALVALAQVSTAAVLPGAMRDFQARLDARLGVPAPPDTGQFGAANTAGALFGAVFALAFLGGWAFAAWKARGGVAWATIVVAVMSGLGVTAGFTVPVLGLIGIHLPGWLLAVTVAGSVVDLVVVGLLVAPATRAWIRAMTPPKPVAAWPPPPGWAPVPGYHQPPPGRRH